MTLNLSEAKNHGCRPHPRGSVRRASGFVLTGKHEATKLLLVYRPPRTDCSCAASATGGGKCSQDDESGERDATINYSMFYCTPWRFPGCPACEPTLFTCS